MHIYIYTLQNRNIFGIPLEVSKIAVIIAMKSCISEFWKEVKKNLFYGLQS